MNSQRIDLTNYLRSLALRILYRGPLSILAETGFASRFCSLLFLPSSLTRVSGLEAAAYGLRQHRSRTSSVLSLLLLPSDPADSSQSPFLGLSSASHPSRSHLIPQCPPLSLFRLNSYFTSSRSASIICPLNIVGTSVIAREPFARSRLYIRHGLVRHSSCSERRYGSQSILIRDEVGVFSTETLEDRNI